VFVRKKRVTKNMAWRDKEGVEPWRGDYYQLVESYRSEDSKTPRQRVVLHLGPHATVDETLKGWPREIRRLRSETTRTGNDKARAAADRIAEKLAQLRSLRDEGKA
jgi:hypothetical protein